MAKKTFQELLDICELTQTDLAMELGYSPSTLSKYLNSEPIKSSELAKSVANKSAYFFLNNLMEKQIVHRLQDIFPLLINSKSNEDVHKFLTMTLEYYLVKNRLEYTPLNYFLNDRFALYGKRELLNYLCIYLSDLLKYGDKDIDLYIQYPFKTNDNFIFNGELNFNSRLLKNKLNIHLIVSEDFIDDNSNIFTLSEFINNIIQVGNLKIYRSEKKLKNPCVLIPNEFYLNIDELPNGELITTNVNDIVLLNSLSKSITDINKENSKTYDLEDLTKIYEQDKEKISRYTNEIHHIFTYLPVSISMVTADFEKAGFKREEYEVVEHIFEGIFKDNFSFYMSKENLTYLEIYRKLYVPFLGEIRIEDTFSNKSVEVANKHHNNYGFINDPYKAQLIACTKDKVMLYTRPTKYNESKIFVFNLGEEKTEKFIKNTMNSDKIYKLQDSAYFKLIANSLGIK